MSEYRRTYILATIILLLYTVLLITPFYLRSTALSASSDSVITPVLGIACLYSTVLYVIISMFRNSGKEIQHLQKRLSEAEDKKTRAEQNHEESMEKRLFEIGVINASLNREIAERIQAETESRALHKRMELILNSAGEGIFGLDPDGRVTFANSAAAVMTGWEVDELVGRSHHELVHHSYHNGSPHAPADCLIKQAYVDGIVHFSSEDVFWTKEGACFPVEYVSTPIIDNTNIRGAVVVFRDKSTFS